MRTFKRICIEDYELSAKNGDRLTLARGHEYITSPTREEDQTCVVFTNFWVRVPATLFAGEKLYTP